MNSQLHYRITPTFASGPCVLDVIDDRSDRVERVATFATRQLAMEYCADAYRDRSESIGWTIDNDGREHSQPSLEAERESSV